MTKLALAMTALVLVVGATLLSASPSTSARSARLPLTLSAPGIAFQKPNALLVAVRLNNIGRGAVLGVKIDSAQLGSARLLSVAPRSVGKIGAGRAAIVQANFRSNGLIQRQRYRLAIRGSFGTTAGKRAPFLAQLVVVLPPAAPGKAPLRHATASPHETKGAPFPARPPRFDRDRNGSRWTVPKGRSVPGRRSARTAIKKSPSVDRFIWLLQGNNGFRLASASPATLLSSGATAWTYWNLPSSLFGQPTGTGVDYPDLSVGDNSLYLSWDVGWP